MASQKDKSAKGGTPKVTQDAPTCEQMRDSAGRLLDEWMLPVTGPDRVAALDVLGRPDPRDEPDAWAEPLAQGEAESLIDTARALRYEGAEAASLQPGRDIEYLDGVETQVTDKKDVNNG